MLVFVATAEVEELLPESAVGAGAPAQAIGVAEQATCSAVTLAKTGVGGSNPPPDPPSLLYGSVPVATASTRAHIALEASPAVRTNSAAG